MSLYPRHLLPKFYYKRLRPTAIPPQAHFLRYIDDQQIFTKDDILNNCDKIFSPSHFPNGCSMNILSIFTKDDVKYKLEKTDSPIFEPWEEGIRYYKPKDEEVTINEDRRFCGIDYSKVRNYEVDVKYLDRLQKKKSGSASYVFEHSPVLTNFWHYNMFLKISSFEEKTEIVCKHQNSEISDSQIKKLIVAQIDDLKDFLLMPSEMKSCKINRLQYISITSILKYIIRIVQKRIS